MKKTVYRFVSGFSSAHQINHPLSVRENLASPEGQSRVGKRHFRYYGFFISSIMTKKRWDGQAGEEEKLKPTCPPAFGGL